MQRDPFTLYVYASRTGSASGQLYVDDGESYDYENGSFIERDLIFANATLESRPSVRTDASGEQSAFAAAMAAVRIERVVVVGLLRTFTTATVVEGDHERSVDVSCGDTECTIRDPAVHITNDWAIRLA
ncbi:glucosidase II [Coemansia sp. RSA 451]|nr:glucosidase II [Coemansia sp. RSA 451]